MLFHEMSELWGMSSGFKSNPIPEIRTAALSDTKGLVCHASLSSCGAQTKGLTM